MCKTIKQKVTFKASPKVIYDLLVDSQKHSAFTGKKASISKKVGGRFSTDDGAVTGVNVDFQPAKRIVQAWRGPHFPVGVFSMATFFLEPTKSGGTELTLIHRGVPKELIPGVEKNWHDAYWARMKTFLQK